MAHDDKRYYSWIGISREQAKLSTGMSVTITKAKEIKDRDVISRSVTAPIEASRITSLT